MSDIAQLIGKTVTEIRGGEDGLDFVCSDGSLFQMFHSQSCCESVTVEDIAGDLNDLIGSPILESEEISSGEHPEGFKPEYEPESYTWTFYKFGTIKGHVTIRWYGTSNGYYSERVTFQKSI